MTTNSASPSGPINGTRLQELRLNVGVSVRALAGRIGVSEKTISNLEAKNGAGSHLKVEQLVRLAELLNTHPADLFEQSATAATPLTVAPEPSAQDDVQRLGAFLSQDRRRKHIPVASLCATLGWTLDRLDEAAAALAEQVRHVGMQVQRSNGTIWISADTQPQYEADVAADIRRLDNHRSLDKVAAQIAWLIYTGNYTALRGGFPETDRVATDTLLKRGIVERDGLAFRCTPAFLAAFA